MKILHTSDWHLGHVLYNYERTAEQKSMLNQIKEIIKNEQPDAMVLCGDVYHTSQPSSTVQTMFTDAIVAMHEACPTMTIVITAGNHDSGTKHEIFQTPWRAFNVHSIGNIDKNNPESHIIEVPGKGFIVAVPYAYERTIPDGFFQQLLDKVEERNTNGLPVVMMAHTTVQGCNFTGHDNASEATVGGIDSMPHEALGIGYDYLALGHIHHAQFIHGTDHRMRYSGTPLAVSFDETFNHSVSIVELNKHGDAPKLTEITIENPRPLVNLPAQGTASWDEAKALLKEFPDDLPAYVRLNVEIKNTVLIGAMEEARNIARGKNCRVCHVNVTRPEQVRNKSRMLTVQELKNIPPLELVKRYASDKKHPFDEEMEEMFKEVIAIIRQEERK